MGLSRKRAMTLALIVLAVLIVGLGVALVATFPWQQAWAQGGAMQPGTAQGIPPGVGPWGYAPGWRFSHGPHFFGGGLLFAVVLVLLIAVAAVRRRHWRYDDRHDALDAEEILRRTFAEGRMTEEEYQSRLRALRK